MAVIHIFGTLEYLVWRAPAFVCYVSMFTSLLPTALPNLESQTKENYCLWFYIKINNNNKRKNPLHTCTNTV